MEAEFEELGLGPAGEWLLCRTPVQPRSARPSACQALRWWGRGSLQEPQSSARGLASVPLTATPSFPSTSTSAPGVAEIPELPAPGTVSVGDV